MKFRDRFIQLAILLILSTGMGLLKYFRVDWSILKFGYPDIITLEMDVKFQSSVLRTELIQATPTTKGREILVNTTETPEFQSTIKDGLSLYIWNGLCTNQLDQLKASPGFPMYPDVQLSTSSLNIRIDAASFGLRVFCHLIPGTSGDYHFVINATNSELWLSTDFDPQNIKLIAKTDTPSQLITLQANKPYYIEVITVSLNHMSILVVNWYTPNGTRYEDISQQYLSHYPLNELANHPNLPSHETQFYPQTLNDPREQFPLFTRLPLSMYPNLPQCSSATIQLTPKDVEPMSGLWSVNENEICLFRDQILFGAPAIREDDVVNMMQFINTYIGNTSELRNFTAINLEKSFSDLRGDQYLLEGKVELNESYIISQAIHVENGSFCTPKRAPNLKAFVHIVIIVKDQKRWVRYFLENVNKIYAQTNDDQFGVIIVDFNSREMRVDKFMKYTLKLKHYQHIPMSGPFNKVRGQNKAIDSVLNPNDIIFTCDLQLNIPINMIDSIRKHTTQGVSVYAPILKRLDCGMLSFYEVGKWEVVGYGLISMHKSDWDVVGGMNVDFGEKWGGEDWDLVDRLLRIGYHIQRLRLSSLVHYHHVKEGDWYS